MWIKRLPCKHENLSIISMKKQNILTHTCKPSVEEAESSISLGSLSRQFTLITEVNQMRDHVPKCKLDTPEKQ